MKRKFGSAKIRTRLIWVKAECVNSLATGAITEISSEIGHFVFAGFLKKYVPQKHLVHSR